MTKDPKTDSEEPLSFDWAQFLGEAIGEAAEACEVLDPHKADRVLAHWARSAFAGAIRATRQDEDFWVLVLRVAPIKLEPPAWR